MLGQKMFVWVDKGCHQATCLTDELFGGKLIMMSSTITMPIGGWLQTFNDFFCFTFSLKPNLCLQVKLFLLIIVKAKNQKTTLLSSRKYPWKMKNRANFGCNA